MTTLAALNLRLSQIKDEIYSLNENMTAEKIKSDFLKQEMSKIEEEIELEKDKEDRFYVGEVFTGVCDMNYSDPHILVHRGGRKFSLCSLTNGQTHNTINIYFSYVENNRFFLRSSDFKELLTSLSKPIEEVSKTRYKSAKDYYKNVFFGDHTLYCTEGSHGDRYYF